MQNDYIDLIEPTPKLHSKKCKIMAFALKIFLQYTTFITALISWYFYDYFIAIATLLLTFIIMGIIRSKIRNSVIPLKQRGSRSLHNSLRSDIERRSIEKVILLSRE